MASMSALTAEMREILDEQPLIDAHTHVDALHPTARGLHDLLLYHMVISDLYSAGCPDGLRLSEWPDDQEAQTRIERALPFVPFIENTSCFWGLRTILKDLYDWTEPITRDNWRRLDGIIRERAGDLTWARAILHRANIRRTCTELWRRHDGRADDLFQYSLEWGFFARNQWGEFDTTLYDLEQTWAQDAPAPPMPVTMGGSRPPATRPVKNLRDVNDALDHYVALIPFDRVVSTAQHLSTDIDYRVVTDADMTAAMKRRDQAGPAERDIYVSYVLGGFLQRLNDRAEPFVFQFSFGAEPLPFETDSRLNQKTLSSVAQLMSRYPRVQFHCYLSSAHANQTLCTMCRELPNIVPVGYWWHNFFPPFIRRVMDERLDMVAVNRQIGFFSDAYTLEWAYAKATIVRNLMSRVLAGKIAIGQYDVGAAARIANEILFVSPQRLLKMVPRA